MDIVLIIGPDQIQNFLVNFLMVAVIGIFQAQHTQTGKMHPLKDVHFLIGIQDLM